VSAQFAAIAADEARRREALDPTRSFLVQAPAGAGKTELLIQRALRLLGLVAAPESIVAITFTRKAAAEMRERILEAFEAAQAGREPERPHQKLTYALAKAALAHGLSLGWNPLDHPARLRIQTIDSLCASITRQAPWRARLGAQPAVTERAREMHAEAARRALLDVETPGEHRAALERLLLHLDNDLPRVHGLLVTMLATREQWLPLAAAPTDDERRRELEDALERALCDGLARVDAMLPQDCRDELAALARFAGCAGVDAMPRCIADDVDGWRALAGLLLTSAGEWRKPGGVNARCGFPKDRPEEKRRFLDLLVQLSAIAGLDAALKMVRSLPPPRYSDEQWAVLGALFTALKLAAGHLKIVFSERGEADFCEIAEAARQALGRPDAPTDLALRLDARIEHLLVDEFQDTSVAQFDLLARLTAGWQPGDGRTLFLVGDPMQSIYRFRQAEVGLFLRAATGSIGEIAPEFLRLEVNHRSTPGVVERVNGIFARIFPAQPDIATGAIPYSPAASGRERDAGEAVTLDAFAKGQDEEEAARVVELVEQGRASGSVAVLVRARTHLPRIVAALRRAGVGFSAIDIDFLGERAVVLDLFALTRAMLHPADRPAWLAILRAPWCGLTLGDLEAIAGADPRAPVWDLVARNAQALSADGQARVAQLRTTLAEAFRERGRLPLRRWVELAWRRMGGPACLTSEDDLADAADYFDLLENSERAGDLADLDRFQRDVAELFAQPDSSADGSVQLMTIHKAKGLEFDTVIVPGLGRRARSDDPQLLLYGERPREDGGADRLLAPIKPDGADADPVYEYLRLVEQTRSEHECVRLLYVAATRARTRLHLLAQVSGKRGVAQPAGGSLLAYLWPGLDAEWLRKLDACVANVAEQTPAAELQGGPLRRLPVDWAPPEPPAAVEWRGPAREVAELEEPSYLWVGDTLRHVGTVVHEMLQRLAGLDEAGVRARRLVFRTALANLGVAPQDLDQATERVEAALLHTLASPRGRWILEAHREARAEYAVAGVVDGEIVRGAIDRTFLDDAGVRWIIDYKTSSHEGAGLETFLDEQQRRYRPQLERYAKLLAPLGQPIRVGLYFPLLDQWREWDAT
jgi:ATP-dependent helicase/nuclease subunit A